MVTEERKAQRQDSVTDQLRDLIQIANHEGMYDAADWIRRSLEFTANLQKKSVLKGTVTGRLTARAPMIEDIPNDRDG